MSVKICIIGAGSASFSVNLVKDVCINEHFKGSTITLVDINEDRLNAIYGLCVRYKEELNADVNIIKTKDRIEGMQGADFVLNVALDGGHERFKQCLDVAYNNGYRFGGSLHVCHDEGFYINFHQLSLMEDILVDMLNICPNAYYILVANPVQAGVTYLQRKYKDAKAAGECRNIIGVYMEGPYLNPKFGCDKENNPWKGPIKREEYQPVIDQVGTDAKVWVLAPERENIEQFVIDARKNNPTVKFAVGHSEASPQQIEALIPYGLCIGTHHTNATGDLPKYPECRGVCVDETVNYNDAIYAEMICDSRGIHVDPYMQRLIRKIKGEDKLVLISDSCVFDGPIPEGYEGVTDLCFDFEGEIAGSKLTLEVACRNMMKHTGASIVDVFRYASTNPSKAVGFTDRGLIAKGYRADLVICDHQMNIKSVILKGEVKK